MNRKWMTRRQLIVENNALQTDTGYWKGLKLALEGHLNDAIARNIELKEEIAAERAKPPIIVVRTVTITYQRKRQRRKKC